MGENSLHTKNFNDVVILTSFFSESDIIALSGKLNCVLSKSQNSQTIVLIPLKEIVQAALFFHEYGELDIDNRISYLIEYSIQNPTALAAF